MSVSTSHEYTVSSIHTIEKSIPDFSDTIDALLALRDERGLSSEDLAEVSRAILDGAVRKHPSVSPVVLVTRFQSALDARIAA